MGVRERLVGTWNAWIDSWKIRALTPTHKIDAVENLLQASNIILDLEALAIGIASAVGLTLDPNSQLDLFRFAYPYDHTILIWAVAYLLVRRFYPLKPVFFMFLWGFQELAWNLVYFAARYPASLAWGSTQGIAGWDKYTIGVAVISIMGFWMLRKRITLDWRWSLAFVLFELVYFLSGVPIVNDRLTNNYIPSNWIWEVAYNVIAMTCYIGMFRERRPPSVESVV